MTIRQLINELMQNAGTLDEEIRIAWRGLSGNSTLGEISELSNNGFQAVIIHASAWEDDE